MSSHSYNNNHNSNDADGRTPTKQPLHRIHVDHATPVHGTRQHPSVILAREQRQQSSSDSSSSREFRHHDLPTYRLRPVDVSQRRAFDLRLPSMEEHDKVAAASTGKYHRISPSKSHLQILHALQNTRYVTQIQFSPSTDYNCDHPTAATIAAASTSTNIPSSSLRDGRYRCINPVEEFRKMISNNRGNVDDDDDDDEILLPPPQLSHRKMRLPNRADVGFPNASSSDIQLKQTEIRYETAWEETSPRIISIVTSEHLGELINNNANRHTFRNNPNYNYNTAKQQERYMDQIATTFPGIPWAGAPLLRARWDNLRHFQSIPLIRADELPKALLPDPYSMLAPPLEATYSKSQGWRPRMVWDRPAGMRYAMATVVQIDLPPNLLSSSTKHFPQPSSAMMPFSCSLSLYTLPPYTVPSNTTTTQSSSLATSSTLAVSVAADQHVSHPSFGKISEELWFPAFVKGGKGDDNHEQFWTSSIHGEIPGPDGTPIQWGFQNEQEQSKTIQAWWEHTKAIFAYDPYELSMENNSNKKTQFASSSSSSSSLSHDKLPSSLYLVLKIYRNINGDKNQEANQPPLLSPVCFGITKFFSSKINMRFPKGHLKEMQLYAFPDIPESQESFVDRLWGVVHNYNQKADDTTSVASGISMSHHSGHNTDIHDIHADDAVTVDSMAASNISSRMEMDTTSKRRGLAGRLFRSSSPKPPPKSKSTLQRSTSVSSANSQTSTATFHTVTSEPIPNARAKFFLSDLHTDFLQVMLSTQAAVAAAIAANNTTTFSMQQLTIDNKTPRLLVDPSGDSAILLFGSNQLGEQPSTDHNMDNKFARDDDGITAIAAKRSNLVRLPPSVKPAGYTAGEFREVLYLRARPEKHYDVDSQFGSSRCTAINLLFIYPRLLQLRQSSRNNVLTGRTSLTTSFTIRIRIIHTDPRLAPDDGPEKCKGIPVKCFYSHSPWVNSDLLESVYTKFSWPSIASNDSDNSSNLDMDRGIPLRDEIKMRLPEILDGNYSAEFTLLKAGVSASNSAGALTLDPVAEATIPLSSSSSRESKAVLRVATAIPNGKHRLELGEFQFHVETRLISSFHIGDPSVAIAIRELGAKSISLEKPFQDANRSACNSFGLDETWKFSSSLLASSSESTIAGHIHVLLHVHLVNMIDRGPEDSESTAVSTIDAIHSLIHTLKKVHSRHSKNGKENDSNHFRSFIKKNLDIFDESLFTFESKARSSQQKSEVFASESFHENDIVAKNEGMTEKNTVEQRDEISARRRRKFARGNRRDSRETRIMPFSRVAYGASKTDRMKAEAELRYDSSHFASFFDDDETIATAPSLYSGTRKIEATATFTFDDARSITRQEQQLANEFSTTNSIARSRGSATSNPVGRRSVGGNDFAKRVVTAAQIMLAPCVGPNLSTRETNSRHVPLTASNTCANLKQESNESHLVARMTAILCAPGSDEEDGSSNKQQSTDSVAQKDVGHTLQESQNIPRLSFSFTLRSFIKLPDRKGKYVYESVMLLWLKVWHDLLEKDDRAKAEMQDGKKYLSDETEIIHGFFANLDFFLSLCLKSIILRYDRECASRGTIAKAALDDTHVFLFESFTEMLARGLIGQALASINEPMDREQSMSRALQSSKCIMDFLVGMISVIDPKSFHLLITRYLKTLRDAEQPYNCESKPGFTWDTESIHRARCSWHLRIDAIERLASLPSFVALNYPGKYDGQREILYPAKPTWISQYFEIDANSFCKFHPLKCKDVAEKVPSSGWLAELVLEEGLSVCARASESLVLESFAQVAISNGRSLGNLPVRNRPGASLNSDDLLMFQEVAVHAVTVVYELVLRRHASLDRRFQSESARSRIAAMFAQPILERSIANVRWLSSMEATNRVRCVWLLCFTFVLQEAPDIMIYDFINSCCKPNDMIIQDFIHILRLSCSTFRGFFNHSQDLATSDMSNNISPWIFQECFNTLCAATNIVVDSCSHLLWPYPQQQILAVKESLDIFLHILTTAQSCVTQLRAVGGAIQVLEEFGVDLFLEAIGMDFQHWARIILSLLNSISLSVRSISIDFIVTLLGNSFRLHGNIDHLTLVFTSILPEVAAREIALYSVGGLLSEWDDVSKGLWPLRRALADLEDTSPVDDDRVDNQLAPLLLYFCRACQAILDGVLVELLLSGDSVVIAGQQIAAVNQEQNVFDADEESLFEAACFFTPETAPMQRIRWLLSLASLHESKGQCVEAAESLFLCAEAICFAMPHLKDVWRPSGFPLWSDTGRSIWLDSVGETLGLPDRGNAEVMSFANNFLEPEDFFGISWKDGNGGTLQQPTVPTLCKLLSSLVKEAIELYVRETGLDELAYFRLESLLKLLMGVVEDHYSSANGRSPWRGSLANISARKRLAEEEAALRRVSAIISSEMTKLAERLLLIVSHDPQHAGMKQRLSQRPRYVVARLHGQKPLRFQESTTIPAFLEWEKPCICRLSKSLVDCQGSDTFVSMEELCKKFAGPLMTFLKKHSDVSEVILETNPTMIDQRNQSEGTTFLDVFPVEVIERDVFSIHSSLLSKHFFYRLGSSGLVEITVAREFPCPLSRQSSLLTTEIQSIKSPTIS